MNSRFLFVEQVDVADRTVLLRLDLNVPMKDGFITDDTRLQRVLPGMEALRHRRGQYCHFDPFRQTQERGGSRIFSGAGCGSIGRASWP